MLRVSKKHGKELLEKLNKGASETVETLTEPVGRPNAVIRNGGPRLLRGLVLPLPPSSNRYWTNLLTPLRGVRFPLTVFNLRMLYKSFRTLSAPSKEAKEYCKAVEEIVIQRNCRFFTEKDLRITVLVCPRDRRKIDAHNYTKVLFDAMEKAGVFSNDSQLVDERTQLGPIRKNGCVIVSLWELPADRSLEQVFNEAFKDG